MKWKIPNSLALFYLPFVFVTAAGGAGHVQGDLILQRHTALRDSTRNLVDAEAPSPAEDIHQRSEEDDDDDKLVSVCWCVCYIFE